MRDWHRMGGVLDSCTEDSQILISAETPVLTCWIARGGVTWLVIRLASPSGKPRPETGNRILNIFGGRARKRREQVLLLAFISKETNSQFRNQLCLNTPVGEKQYHEDWMYWAKHCTEITQILCQQNSPACIGSASKTNLHVLSCY